VRGEKCQKGIIPAGSRITFPIPSRRAGQDRIQLAHSALPCFLRMCAMGLKEFGEDKKKIHIKKQESPKRY